jgi:hypothetical protein
MDFKNDFEGISLEKIFGEMSVEYLVSISRTNLK